MSGFTDSAYRVCDSDRCLNYRLGSTLSGGVNGRDMVSSRTQKTHKCAGNDSHKISPVHFHKDEECEVNSLSDRQYGGSKLSSEGGSSQPGTVTASKRDLGLSFHQPDHDYCRISPQSLEFEDRLGVSQSLRLKRVKTRPSNLQEYHCQVRNTRHTLRGEIFAWIYFRE